MLRWPTHWIHIGFLLVVFVFESSRATPPPNYWLNGDLIFIGTPLKRKEVQLTDQTWQFRTFFSVEILLKGPKPRESLIIGISTDGKPITKQGFYVDCVRGPAGTGDRYWDQLPPIGVKRVFIFAKTRP